MTVGTLDRRMLFVLLGGLLLIVVLRFGVYGDRPTQVVAPSESIPAAGIFSLPFLFTKQKIYAIQPLPV